MDINEKEAAAELRKLGFKSSWGCKDGVFLSSADVFRLVLLFQKLIKWCDPAAKRTSFTEVIDILREALGKRVGQSLWRAANSNKSNNKSGKGAYNHEPPKVSKLDLE